MRAGVESLLPIAACEGRAAAFGRANDEFSLSSSAGREFAPKGGRIPGYFLVL